LDYAASLWLGIAMMRQLHWLALALWTLCV